MKVAWTFITSIFCSFFGFAQTFDQSINVEGIIDFNLLQGEYHYDERENALFYAQRITDSVYLQIVIVKDIAEAMGEAPDNFPEDISTLLDQFLQQIILGSEGELILHQELLQDGANPEGREYILEFNRYDEEGNAQPHYNYGRIYYNENYFVSISLYSDDTHMMNADIWSQDFYATIQFLN